MYSRSDIDIFASSFEHSLAALPDPNETTSADILSENVARTIYDSISKPHNWRYLCVRSQTAFSFCGEKNKRNIQIINCGDRTPEDALMDFDIDCVTFAYDGDQVFTLPRGKRAITTFCNFMDPFVLRFRRTRNRVAKYFNRGFSALLFENCSHFPRCDVVLEPNLVALWEQTKSISFPF